MSLILASVILDPQLCNLERNADFFNKSIVNPLLQSIFNIVKKHEFDSDLFCVAMKAFAVIIKAVYSFFDSKCHQASMEHFKQIVQIVFKRVETFTTSTSLKSEEADLKMVKVATPMMICLKGINIALNLFPNCCA